MATVAQTLVDRAAATPDRRFLWCGDVQRTFGEMQTRADAVAGGFSALGVAPGEHVAIVTTNRSEMLDLYFGCARLGAVQVPLNVFLKGEFLRYQLDDSEATTLVVDAAGYRAARPLLATLPMLRHVVLLDEPEAGVDAGAVECVPIASLEACAAPPPPMGVAEDDLMSILYTSGTTGLPKGCMLSHGYYLRASWCVADWLDIGVEDTHLTLLPLFHASARLCGVGSALVTGSTAVIETDFKPSRFVARAIETGATVSGGTGVQALMILNQAPSEMDRATSLRTVWFTPVTAETQAELRTRYGVDMQLELYGQTECVPQTYSSFAGLRKPGTSGRPAPDLEVAVVDDGERPVLANQVGEIVVRPRAPHAIFKGYWRKPEATLEAFRNLWYHTGDTGSFDDDGFLTFSDRKRDVIRRRGEVISSLMVESAIGQHPLVAEVAVHAVPSDMSEDDIKACVVVVAGGALDPGELFDFLKDRLPYYAVPRYVEVLDELPKNALSRVMKHELRDRGVTAETWDFDELGLSVARSERRA